MPPQNKRLERTRYKRASLLSCVGEPLKRSVSPLLDVEDGRWVKILVVNLPSK
jgi:hypothetical protein